MSVKHILLTGSPGVGKTTIVKKLVEKLKDADAFPMNGFYTEELRDGRSRIGFDVVGLNGTRFPLARIETHLKFPVRRQPKVGKYTVLVDDFDKFALPFITMTFGLIVVDEIGKMELFSSKFKSQIMKLLNCNKVFLLGTIPVNRNISFIEHLRQHSDINVIEVTLQNRDDSTLIDDIIMMIKQNIKTDI